MSEVVYSLAVYYNYGLLVIEKASGGNVVLDHLRGRYKYKNLYKYKSYDDRGRAKKKIGFNTTEKSRSILINKFREVIEEGEVLINSKDILNEMLTFVADKNSKVQHTRGSHDDSLFSAMLSVFGLSEVHYR